MRRHPGSRRVPWTRAAELERVLGSAGIGYLHLPELGGRRRPSPDSPNGGWRVAGFRGYADHMGSEELEAGLRRLLERARERRTAMMCAEAQWWRCHRQLISDALLARGWTVLHVGPRGEATEHELTGFAVVEGERVRYPPPQEPLGP